MRRSLVILLVGIVCCLVAGCKVYDEKASVRPQKPQIHGSLSSDLAKTPGVGVVEVVKTQKLLNYTSMTIGQAFGSYRHFDSASWRETKNPNKKIYIDYLGLKKYGLLDSEQRKKQISMQGVEVKFVVNPGGALYVAMISRAEVGYDGRIVLYPLEDKKRVLDAIYANREIK